MERCLSSIPPFAERAATRKRGICLAAGLLTLVTACATVPQADGSPDRVWASPRTLDDATACVIKALDRYGHSESSPSTMHSIRPIVPGAVNEVRPRQDFALYQTSYFVRLQKTADQITRIALYDKSAAERPLIKALTPCGE
jgi:hypothetical protein